MMIKVTIKTNRDHKRSYLQNSSRELNGVFNGAIKCIDNCRIGVSFPVSLVYFFPELGPVIVGAPYAHIDAVLEVGIPADFQALVKLVELVVIQNFWRIGDVVFNGT